MKLTVAELVDVILRRIQEHPERPMSETTLRSWLSRQGYAKGDIEAAMKFLGKGAKDFPSPHRFAAAEAAAQGPGSLRSLSLHEEYKLDSEARDALTRLDLCGLIGPYERELVLEHLGHFDGEVGLAELDYLVSWLVCSGRDVEFQQTVAKVLEGQGEMLH